MVFVKGNDIGKEISDIFGLKNVTSIDFHFAVDKIVSVDVKFYPEKEEMEKFMSILKRYELEKTGDDPYEKLTPLLQKFHLVEKESPVKAKMILFGEKPSITRIHKRANLVSRSIAVICTPLITMSMMSMSNASSMYGIRNRSDGNR